MLGWLASHKQFVGRAGRLNNLAPSCIHLGSILHHTPRRCDTGAMPEGEQDRSRGGAAADSEALGGLQEGALVGGRFRLRERLGHGLSGESWRADDLASGGSCALKVSGLAGDAPDGWAAVRAEARRLRRLAHPNLARFRAAVFEPETPIAAIATELAPGETVLDAAARRRGQRDDAIGLLVGCARGLAALHGADLVHRDLQPRNVVLTRGGGERSAVILDLGLASARAAVPRGVLTGTLGFAAPEVILDGAADARSDLYSLGAVLFHLLAGEAPVAPARVLDAIVRGRDPFEEAAARARAELPAPFAAIAERLLARHPHARFQDPAEVIAAVNEAFGERFALETPSSRRPAVARPAFVGRAKDLARCVRHLTVHLYEGGALLVRGPRGTGRSRFLEEAVRALAFRGERVVEVRGTTPDGAPLAPLVAGLSAQAHRLSADAAAEVRRAAGVLSAAGADEAHAAADAIEALRRAVLDASSRAPLVLAVDDAHLLDDFTIDFLRRCAEEALDRGRGPTLAVTVADADGTHPVPIRLLMRAVESHPRPLVLDLAPLGAVVTGTLVRGILPLPEFSRDLLDRVRALAEGKPRAVVEIVQGLLDRALVHRPGGWGLTDPGDELPVPATLRDAGAARLAGLGPEQRDALLGVALHEGAIPRAGWAALRRASGLTEAAEADLRRRGLLARVEPGGGAVVAAESVRRALVEECGSVDRKRWGRVLADLVPPGSPARVRHLLDGGLGERAIREGTEALRSLRVRRRLDAGLALAARLAAEANRRPRARCADLLDEAAELAMAAERHDLGLEFLARGLARDGEAGPGRLRLLVRQREILGLAGKDPDAASDPLSETDLPGDLSARVLFARAARCVAGNRWAEGAALLEQALGAVAVAPVTEARVLNALASIRAHDGRLDEAAALYERALQGMRGAGDDARALVVAGNLARFEVRRGRPRRALRMIDETAGALRGRATAGEELALLVTRVGALEALARWDLAAAAAERALALAQEVGSEASEVQALRRLGDAQVRLGRFGAGVRSLTRALRLARVARHSRERDATRCILAEVYLGRGDARAASRCLDGIPEGTQPAGFLRALCAASEGATEESLAGIRYALADASCAAWPGSRFTLRRAEAALLARAGRGSEASSILDEECRLARRAGSADALGMALLDRLRLAREGEGSARVRLRRGIARLAPRLPNLLLRGELLEALGRTAADPKEARRLLGEAAALFARCSLPERARAATEGISSAPAGPGLRGLGPERLAWVLEQTARLNSAPDPEAVLAGLLDAALALTGAERGFLVLARDDGFEVREARQIGEADLEEREGNLSVSLVRKVLEDGRSITTTNASEDPRFALFLSVHRLQLRSILVVPLLRGDRVLGAFYLDNRFVEGAFGDEDRASLEVFAEQAGLAFENLSYRARVQALNRRLEERLSDSEQRLDRMQTTLRTLEGETRYAYDRILRSGGAMAEALRLVDRAVDSEIAVLLEGESGTGKELVARALHLYGPRRGRPFVVVNCAALPETLIESELFGHARGAFTGAHADREGQFAAADGGTLFLDEIGEMPLSVQPKLLRALQSGEFVPLGSSGARHSRVRLVCATNRDLRARMARGEFREDLYYRIAGFPIRLPPLRERRQDIPLIANALLRRFCEEFRVPHRPLEPRALARLVEHDWPGNVRELENVLRRAVLLCDGEAIRPADLPLDPPAHAGGSDGLDRIVRAFPGLGGPREVAALARVIQRGSIRQRELMQMTGLSRAVASRTLRRLHRAGVIVRHGKTTASYYTLDARHRPGARPTQD